MATTLTVAKPVSVDHFDGQATAGNLEEITIPSDTQHITLRVDDGSGNFVAFEVSHTGTDGGAITAANAFRFSAGEAFTLNIPHTGDTVIYVASVATANCDISVVSVAKVQ